MDPREIARLCCDFYKKLPKKGKPLSERGEWTVLSAFVQEDCEKKEGRVIALGTGTKCLGASEVAKNGTSLNDGHAEVVARRALMLYLIDQLKLAKEGQIGESIFEPTEDSLYRLRSGIVFHFFSSHVPCGDASILPKFFDSADNERENAGDISEGPSAPKRPKIDDVHRTGAKCVPNGVQDPLQPGVDYHVTGAFRTKPGRGEPTASLSCSDKMARWHHLGLQGAFLSRFFLHPLKWESIVISSQEDGGVVRESVQRAICGRFSSRCCNNRPNIFIIGNVEFEHARSDSSGDPAPGSIIWCHGMDKPEVAVDGYKLGATKKILGTERAATPISPLMLTRKYVKDVLNDGNFCYSKEKECSPYRETWKQLMEDVFVGWPDKPSKLDFQVKLS